MLTFIPGTTAKNVKLERSRNRDKMMDEHLSKIIEDVYQVRVEEMPYSVLKDTSLSSFDPNLRVAAIQEAIRRLRA